MARGRKPPTKIAQDALEALEAQTQTVEEVAQAIAQSVVNDPAFKPIKIDMNALTLDDLPFIHRLRRFYNDEKGDDVAVTDMEIIAVLDRAVVGGKQAVPLTRYREAIYSLLIAVFGAGNPETDRGN